MNLPINPSHIDLIVNTTIKAFDIGTIRFRRRGCLARQVVIYLLKEAGLSASEIVGLKLASTERIVYNTCANIKGMIQTSPILRVKVQRLIQTIIKHQPPPNRPILETLSNIKLPQPIILKKQFR